MMEINTYLRVVVAGCGSAGRMSIREFLKFDELEICACCDSEESLARFTSQEFGIPAFYTDLADMLEEEPADVLVIALPDGEHLNAAIEAFSRGINVFCESPLAPTYAEAVEMTKAARESDLVAVVNSYTYSIPSVAAALNYIKSGKIGNLKYLEASFIQNRLDSRIINDQYEEKRLLWRLSAAAGSAGAIGELGFTLYSIASEVCGEPETVSTMIKNLAGFDQIEEYKELNLTAGDTFVSQLDFKSGAAAVLRGSWTVGGPHEQLTISAYGEDAMLSLDLSDSETGFKVISPHGVETEAAAGYLPDNLYESFIAAINGNGHAVSDFDNALKIQYYIEQSVLSNDGGLRLQFEDSAE